MHFAKKDTKTTAWTLFLNRFCAFSAFGAPFISHRFALPHSLRPLSKKHGGLGKTMAILPIFHCFRPRPRWRPWRSWDLTALLAEKQRRQRKHRKRGRLGNRRRG